MPRTSVSMQAVHPVRIHVFESGERQVRQVIERSQFERTDDVVLVDDAALASFTLASQELGFRGRGYTHLWREENVMFLVASEVL